MMAQPQDPCLSHANVDVHQCECNVKCLFNVCLSECNVDVCFIVYFGCLVA